MAFESLTDRLAGVFKKLRGHGKLTEADIKAAMREVRMALLEADVNYKVAKDFCAKVSERAMGQEVMESLTPAQQVVKIVNEELTELMGGSTSGYGNDKYYYAGDTPNQKGVYDVIDDVLLTKLDVDNKSNPRQSMRLRDIVDVYLLMYSLSETTASGGDINGARTYTISTTSWLVGEKHGTNKDDAIVIANKQNVALLRQLRFATFVLMVDLTSYEVQSFGGAFYGTIYYQNGHSNPTEWLNASFADVTKATIVNE